MGNRNKYIFSTMIAVWLCVSTLGFAAADNPPTEMEINALAETTREISDKFMAESRQLRLKYQFIGKFKDHKDNETLLAIAETASGKLRENANDQQLLKKQIEEYSGDDWEVRYGATGIWRELASDTYVTFLDKYQIDFYRAICSEQTDRILQNILSKLDSMQIDRLPAESSLLKAKTLGLLARGNIEYKISATEQFNMLSARSDMSDSTAFRVELERIRILGETEYGQLNELVEVIGQTDCVHKFELAFSAASLQRNLSRPESFRKTVKLFPQIKKVLGEMLLQELSQRQSEELYLEKVSVFEAELAVNQIWDSNDHRHKELLGQLCKIEKFQTPLILYVSAIWTAKSSPLEAVNLLAMAGNIQQLQKDDSLDISAEEISAQAAKLAYNLLVDDSGNCSVALWAFENYYKSVNDKPNEQMQYLYSVVLNDCGQEQKAGAVLKKLAKRLNSTWSLRARFDLIARELKSKTKPSAKQLKQLRKIMTRSEDPQLQTEAQNLYCQLLIESKDNSSAQKVLDILAETKSTKNLNVDLLKAGAFQQLGQLDKAVGYMVLAVEYDGESTAVAATALLGVVIEKIDYIEADSGNEMMANCKKLAEFCHLNINDRKSGAILAEITVLAAAQQSEQLVEAKKLLDEITAKNDQNDIDLLRCKARLSTAEGNFGPAARLWAKIADIRKSKSSASGQRTEKWWRAKFYEIYCWSKLPETKNPDVLHSIEVLENSFSQIEPLWAEKFAQLKEHCSRKPSIDGK